MFVDMTVKVGIKWFRVDSFGKVLFGSTKGEANLTGGQFKPTVDCYE